MHIPPRMPASCFTRLILSAMPRAPLPANESERLAALRQCCVLDTEPEIAFDDLTELAVQVCDTPIALVSLVDAERQWFKSARGVDARETHRDAAFCAHAILGSEPFVVTNALTDVRTSDNPLVTGDPGIRFYVGIPLITNDGYALGTLCVIDLEPREVSPRQLDDLQRLARQAVAQLELRRANRQQRQHVASLTQSHQQLAAQAKALLCQTEALQEARQNAEEASRSKSAFLANMSHEIRTPLTSILSAADLLGDGELQSEGPSVEHVTTIRQSANHLLSIISDILDLSKIEAGSMLVEYSDVRPEEVLNDVLTVLAPTAERKGIRLMARTESDVPTVIQSDAARLRQVLMNLIGNAIKFTHVGGVEIVATVDEDRQQSYLHLHVVDTGIGLSDQQCQQIFEPFVQADVSTTREYGGTGLGLAISQRMVHLLNGTLDVTSIPGSGSAFTVSLPFAKSTATMTDCYRFRSDRSPEQAGTTNSTVEFKGRVLLVEDNRVNQRLISAQLKKSGATVEMADNGAAAVRRILDTSRPAFDVVVMDMQMPVLDGYDATKKVRQQGIDVPIIALTAHAMAHDRIKCLDAGCSDFLTKPVRRELLTEVCLRHAQPSLTKHRTSASSSGLPEDIVAAT